MYVYIFVVGVSSRGGLALWDSSGYVRNTSRPVQFCGFILMLCVFEGEKERERERERARGSGGRMISLST